MSNRFDNPPELLAPAGRWEALLAVVEAGADAVYLGAKQWNMRMHRGDFHFTREQIAQAVELLHGRGRKLYVTVNNLLGDEEVEPVRDFLRFLDGVGVDAAIVTDLAALALIREEGLSLPAHASTMLNVHCPAMARVLRGLGVTRVITSRDIDVREAAALASAGVEVEYFVHGDMCVAQSGQCNASGIGLGKSANRGECMKPCRWDYDLVTLGEGGGEVVGQVREGFLLSIKDLALLRKLPHLVRAGIRSFKIEGRMRDAAYLHHVVSLYRSAIDDYFASPPTYFTRVTDLERLHQRRLRELSSLTALGATPSAALFDTSGERETVKLADGAPEDRLTLETVNAPASEAHAGAAQGAPATPLPIRHSTLDIRHSPRLSVCVSDLASARAALDAGADRICLASEVWQLKPDPWTVDAMAATIAAAPDAGATAVLRTPRITAEREWDELAWLLERLAGTGVGRVLAGHYGIKELVDEQLPGTPTAADFGFNVLNARTADLLADLGYVEATASVEAGLEEVAAIASAARLPIELIGHGPLTGMMIEHCVIALNTAGAGSKDVCRGPCQHVRFALRDRAGEVRPIVTDQYCRNHYMMARELCTLGWLGEVASAAVASLRIEAQYYERAGDVAAVTRLYRRGLDDAAAGRSRAISPGEFAALSAISPLGLGRGALGRRIAQSEKTVRLMRKLHATA
ncbi:MAG: hypothetical protein BIFFINMI_02118 [Phycisphaerae bacterium]|nr:hypothetical protein [Phycisphaerae bacterium]